MLKFLEALERAVVKLRRKRLANEIFHQYDGIIQYGTFAGTRFSGKANVSQGAHALKIFGLYELPVIQTLVDWCPAQTLVNIGAGDGYYSVGMLKAGLVQQSICFEMTEAGRQAVKRNAELNGVESQISVHGTADVESLNQVLRDSSIDLKETIILCDIEGAEFSLFNAEIISLLQGSKLVIELHEWNAQTENCEQMMKQFHQSFSTTVMTDQARAWQGIRELETLHGIDRALVTSEGRKYLGEWLVVTPKAA